VRDGIGIGHLEAPFLKVIAVVEFGAADKKGALGINHDVHPFGRDEDVARLGAVDEIHLVLEAGTATPDDRDAEGAIGSALFGQQGGEPVGSGIGDTAELLVPDFQGRGAAGVSLMELILTYPPFP